MDLQRFLSRNDFDSQTSLRIATAIQERLRIRSVNVDVLQSISYDEICSLQGMLQKDDFDKFKEFHYSYFDLLQS
jgi:hypothetical protein